MLSQELFFSGEFHAAWVLLSVTAGSGMAALVVGFALTFGKLILSGHIDEVVDTIEGNIRHAGEALDTL